MKIFLLCLFAATALHVSAQDITQGTFPEPKKVTNRKEQMVHMGLNLGFNNPSGGYDTSLARGSYNFGGAIPVIRHSYVGMGAGPVVTGNTWDVGLAPLAGFDIPVNEQVGSALTLGANLKYLYTTSATADAFMMSAAVKYWC